MTLPREGIERKREINSYWLFTKLTFQFNLLGQHGLMGQVMNGPSFLGFKTTLSKRMSVLLLTMAIKSKWLSNKLSISNERRNYVQENELLYWLNEQVTISTQKAKYRIRQMKGQTDVKCNFQRLLQPYK